jgi:hypothetical protein
MEVTVMDPGSEREHLQSLLSGAIAAVEAFRAADEAYYQAESTALDRTSPIRDRREWKFISRSVSATHALKALVDIRNEF